MAEVFLNIALIDLGAAGKPGAQRVAGIQAQAVGLGQVGAQASRVNGVFDQSVEYTVQ